MASQSQFLQDFSKFLSYHCNHYNDEEDHTNEVNVSSTLNDNLNDDEEEARNTDSFEPIPLELAKEQDQHQRSLLSQVDATDANTMINILSHGDNISNPKSTYSSYARSDIFNIDNMPPKNQFPRSSYPSTLTHFRRLSTNDRNFNKSADITSLAGNMKYCALKMKGYSSESTIARHDMSAVSPPTLCYHELEQGTPKRLKTHFQDSNSPKPIITSQHNKIDQSKQVLPSGKPQLKMKMRLIERHGQKSRIVMEPVWE